MTHKGNRPKYYTQGGFVDMVRYTDLVDGIIRQRPGCWVRTEEYGLAPHSGRPVITDHAPETRIRMMVFGCADQRSQWLVQGE